jgi:Fe-S-cluster-containing hydrogenase component 2
LRKLVADSAKCTGCGACEETCSKTYFKVADKEKSAIRIVQEDGRHCVKVCDQCGDCMKMCSPIALSKADNGVVKIAKDVCVGCLVCVAECLRGYMHYHDDLPTPFKCVACGLCAKSCEAGALSIADA